MKMYLFIFESIGTSELLLIGVVALIVFGPRKLPEMMRMFGKAMAEFRKSTNEFKESWEREVSIENLENQKETVNLEIQKDNTIGRSSYTPETSVVKPEIKQMSKDEFDQVLLPEKNEDTIEIDNIVEISAPKSEINNKRDWL